MHARHVTDGQDVPGVRDDLAGQADQEPEPRVRRVEEMQHVRPARVRGEQDGHPRSRHRRGEYDEERLLLGPQERPAGATPGKHQCIQGHARARMVARKMRHSRNVAHESLCQTGKLRRQRVTRARRHFPMPIVRPVIR